MSGLRRRRPSCAVHTREKLASSIRSENQMESLHRLAVCLNELAPCNETCSFKLHTYTWWWEARTGGECRSRCRASGPRGRSDALTVFGSSTQSSIMASTNVPNPPDSVSFFEESITAHWSNAYQPRVAFYKSVINSRHSSAKAPHEVLKQIRKESSIIKTQHALLNECENALLPVSRLAPEILAHVFHFLAEDLPLIPEHAEMLRYGPLPLLNSWTKVLHVSRNFRRTALGDPSLWPAVTTALGWNWMDRLIDLSGSTYITFHIGTDSRGMEQSIQSALLKVSTRVRSLQITSNAKGLRALKLPPLEMPVLQSIRFHGYDGEEEYSSDDEGLVPLWDLNVLTRVSMPAVQELSVHGFDKFPRVSNLLQTSLTSLHIGVDLNYSYVLVKLPPLQTFLGALSRLVNLTELSLERCQVEADEPRVFPISLPHLTELWLDGCDYMTLATLFAYLHTPPEAKLYLCTDLERFNHLPNEISPLFFDTLKRHLTTPACQDVRTVEYLTKPEEYPEMYPTISQRYNPNRSNNFFIINAWRQDDSRIVCADCERVPRHPSHFNYYDRPYDLVRYDRPEPDLTLAFEFGSRNPFKLTDECLGLFAATPSVKSLSLRFDYSSWKLSSWRHSLEDFANVNFLRADGSLGHDVLERLYSLGIESEPNSSLQRLPELKRLAILRDGDVQWRVQPNVAGLESRLDLLVKVWDLRKANGVPLQEVVLDERRSALLHYDTIRKTVNLRPIHLWSFDYPDRILSEEEDEEEDEEEEDEEYPMFGWP
ncbi:hypothetical protein PENSPDRAFT_736644 [Peniophora sp. CONT]|nr:hypothetical protein PENSPDRAFT_736644 [Peniophora sp. CONT]